ncbi:CARDB domain-containing protein [Halobaculum gomorrense]|uniref:CARDB protein n=1 Tax=Halobaculum gomorrense TaxID=43928 RepID=A0A1M5KQR3_9EURY|nr:CARDB domain-containing protein [Halobaculum gomorrense]SHG55111.1 CARDB protein [Halobaculum gomorrense]
MGARSAAVRGAVVLFIAALFVGPAVGGTAGAQASSCQANGNQQVCLTDASLGSTTVTAGESTELSLTVENVGDERATAVVVLNVASPDNETNSYELRKRSLAPGETLTVTQSIDASTPGTHAMQAIVYGDGYAHRYDASEPMQVTVERQGLGGSIDAPEYALAALFGSIAVVTGMAYRRR